MTRRRAGALAAAALVALAGCGGGGDDDADRVREQVNAYAKAENAVLARLAPDVDRINKAYVAFSKGELGPRRAQERLGQAEAVVREVRDELGELQPPPAARELQARIERYLALTVDLAVQARRLAGYEPAARAALRPLPGINEALQEDLSAAQVPAAQADVLRDYTDGLDGVIADLEAVRAPVVQLPAHRDQVRRVRRTRELGVRLREALTEEDPEAVAELLTRFRDQADERVPVRRLGARGLRAYRERVDALKAAAADIRREQLSLYQRTDPR